MSATDTRNLVGEVTDIVDSMAGSAAAQGYDRAGLRSALAALEGVDASDLQTLRFNEYEISVGWGGLLKDEADVLTLVRPLDLSIAPEVATLLKTPDGYVLVRRYWACSGERLTRVADGAVRLSEEARTRFRDDLQRLAAQGLMQPRGRGTAHWLVSSDTGTLVLDGWIALSECRPDECADMLRRIDTQLRRAT